MILYFVFQKKVLDNNLEGDQNVKNIAVIVIDRIEKNVANKKDHNKLLELVDDKAIENLGNIKAMLESNEIRQEYIKATENLSVDGDVKKIA